MSGSRAERALDALNPFLSDVRYGLGAYLAVYPLERHAWDEAGIGVALSPAPSPPSPLRPNERHARPRRRPPPSGGSGGAPLRPAAAGVAPPGNTTTAAASRRKI
jgi:hypothetical protein